MTPRPQDLPMLLPILEESSISSNNSEGTQGIEMVHHATKHSGEGVASMLSTADSTLLAVNEFPRERSGCEIASNRLVMANKKVQKTAQGHGSAGTTPKSHATTIDITMALQTNSKRCLQSDTSGLPIEISSVQGVGDFELPLVQSTTPRKTRKTTVQAKEIIQVPLIGWKDCNGPWKNVLIMGDSETDKSWTLTKMVNFLMGVEFNDPFRYNLVSSERSKFQSSQNVRAFSFFPLHSNVSYGITLIDALVFGEPATSIKDDDDIWNTVKGFCEKNLSKIDAVCFMVQSTCSHLTKRQYHLYEKVSSFLGEYALEKIFMTTSGCGAKQRLSMSTIHRMADVQMERCTVLNRSPSWCSNYAQQNGLGRVKDEYGTTGDNRFDLLSQTHWDADCKVLKQFFAHDLCKVPATLLNQKKRVVSSEHESLKNVIVSINNQIRIGLDTLECIRQTVCTVTRHQKDLDTNADLKLKVPRTRFCKIDLSKEGAFTTTCLMCNFACCDPCKFSNECGVIDSAGRCQICPGKCTLKMHKSVPYLVKHTTDWADETLLEEDEAAEAAESGMSHTEAILRKQRALYNVTKTQILRDIGIVRSSLNHLSQENPRYGFIDSDYHFQRMIHAEIKRGETGFQGRVQALRTMLEQARCLRESEGADSSSQLDDMDTVLVQIDREVQKCSQQSRGGGEKPNIMMAIPRLFW